MKFFIVLALLVAVALADKVDDTKTVVLESDSDVRPDGYEYSFKTSDGVVRSEVGSLKNVGTEDESISVKGSFTYTAADGLEYTVNYIADENGFQPQGKHLPVA